MKQIQGSIMTKSINIKTLTYTILTLLLVNEALASDTSDNKNNLVASVTCDRKATPQTFLETISAAGGKSIISGNLGSETDSIFSLPTPANVWGYQVTHFSLHRGSNDDGDFDEFAAIINLADNLTTVDMVANQGKVPKIADNYFMAKKGNDDLVVRQYGDTILVSCANDVRTIQKKIQKDIRQIQEKFGG